MTKLKMFALAATAAAGIVSFSSSSHAQYYQQNPYGYAPRGHYYQQPQYVDPRVARKQLQQQKRFIQKFGHQPQAPQYGYGYGQQQYYYEQPPRQRYYRQGPSYYQ